MTSTSGEETLEQAIQAIKRGDKGYAQGLLAELLARNAQNDRAWSWLAVCLSDPEKKRYCLEKALAIRPDNPRVRRALDRLGVSSRGKRPGFSALQTEVLLFLVSVTLVTLVGSLLLVSPEAILVPLQAALPTYLPNTPLPEAHLHQIQLPPTWTWTPQLPATHTATTTPQPPTATFTNSPTPIASLTPHPLHWQILIGHSVGRRPINVYRFGNGRKERMIVAGIHGGNEWNTIALANELVAYLRERPETIPSEVTLFILPSLNPDGEARAHSPDGRTNEHGVDLNRNWDANWRSNWPRDGCWSLRPTTGGPHPNSEPETQALANFLLSHKVEVLISYHSAALGVFPSGDPPDPASVRLAEAIAGISDYRYPPADTGCEFSGTLPDWALKNGITAVDLELSNHTDTDFQVNLKILLLLLTWES